MKFIKSKKKGLIKGNSKKFYKLLYDDIYDNPENWYFVNDYDTFDKYLKHVNKNLTIQFNSRFARVVEPEIISEPPTESNILKKLINRFYKKKVKDKINYLIMNWFFDNIDFYSNTFKVNDPKEFMKIYNSCLKGIRTLEFVIDTKRNTYTCKFYTSNKEDMIYISTKFS